MKRIVCTGVLLGISLLVITASYACSCGGLPTPYARFASADFVFSGTVASKQIIFSERPEEGSWSRYGHTVQVNRVWKGDVQPEEILYQTGGFDCQYDFNIGGTYLIYAYAWPHPETQEPITKTSLCSKNKQFVEAQEDLAWLGAGHAPTGERIGFLKNYPNPFRGQTRLVYDVPREGFVEIEVYDIRGRRQRQLVAEVQAEGLYTLPFDANGLAPGVYLCRLQLEEELTIVRPVVVMN